MEGGPLWKQHHRYTKRLVSSMILNAVKLKIKTNRHKEFILKDTLFNKLRLSLGESNALVCGLRY